MTVPKNRPVKKKRTIWALSQRDREFVWKWKRVRRALWREGFVVVQPVAGLRIILPHEAQNGILFASKPLPIERLIRAQTEKLLAAQLTFYPRNALDPVVTQC